MSRPPSPALVTAIKRSLDSGVSVEGVVNALCVAISERYRESGRYRPQYRLELSVFYRGATEILRDANQRLDRMGKIASATARRLSA
jgi:hypothetical protein